MLVNAQLSASLRSETVTPRFEAHARTNFCHSQALCTKAYTFCSQDIYSYSISNKSEEVLTNPFNHMHCCPYNTNVSVSSSLFHIFSRRYGHKKWGHDYARNFTERPYIKDNSSGTIVIVWNHPHTQIYIRTYLAGHNIGIKCLHAKSYFSFPLALLMMMRITLQE